jgi:hypothetical protein
LLLADCQTPNFHCISSSSPFLGDPVRCPHVEGIKIVGQAKKLITNVAHKVANKSE